MEVNDIIEFTFMYEKWNNNNFTSEKDTVFSARFRVESITTNTQNIKTVNTKILEEDILDFDGILVPPFWYYSYTEKIGLHNEFMPVIDNIPHPLIQDYKWLRCYSDTDFSFISDEWAAISLSCDYSIAMDIDMPQNENMNIYPNPFNNKIFVSTSNEANIEIIDISGTIVYYPELSNGINEIPTRNLFKGIYLVKIQNKDNSTQFF